jgi:hypothetical protein
MRLSPALVHGSYAPRGQASITWPQWPPGEDDLGMKSRVHPNYKTKYRVGNWAEYDRALVQRGDLARIVASRCIRSR